MKRNIEDASLAKSKALPAAGASANSAVLDLINAGGVEACELVIGHEALPNLANTKTATLTVQESDEAAANFAAIPALDTFVTTGGASGADAANRAVRLPSNTKRYVRLNVAVEANGGDNTAEEAFIKLKF